MAILRWVELSTLFDLLIYGVVQMWSFWKKRKIRLLNNGNFVGLGVLISQRMRSTYFLIFHRQICDQNFTLIDINHPTNESPIQSTKLQQLFDQFLIQTSAFIDRYIKTAIKSVSPHIYLAIFHEFFFSYFAGNVPKFNFCTQKPIILERNFFSFYFCFKLSILQIFFLAKNSK